MPLSEDEQRILRQIEQDLRSDPTFADTGYRAARGRLVLLSIGLLICLAVTIVGLSVNFLVAFAGFLAVFAIAVMLEKEIRLISRERLGDLSLNSWLVGRRPKRDQ